MGIWFPPDIISRQDACTTRNFGIFFYLEVSYLHFWDISNLFNFGVELKVHTTANSPISQNKLKTLPVFSPKKIAPCFGLRRRITEGDALRYNVAR
jgi:hypothetical protein